MGQSSSSLPSSLPDLALHCLRVADRSPASGHLEPFFDYLVGIETPDQPSSADAQGQGQGNGQGMIGLSPAALGRILEDNEGKKVGLKVYNAKSQRIRGGSSPALDVWVILKLISLPDVHLIPNRTWSEAALAQETPSSSSDTRPKPSLLGLSLRACNPANALESVYHVLDVLEGSPAEVSLRPLFFPFGGMRAEL